jgi:hypothetical protein
LEARGKIVHWGALFPWEYPGEGCSYGREILPSSTGFTYSTGDTFGPFSTSTEWLQGGINNRYLNVSPAYFTTCKAWKDEPDHVEFCLFSEENVWCVVEDLTHSTSPECPALFTRNLAITNLNDNSPSLAQAIPFGERGAVVVTRNGNVQFMNIKEIRALLGSHTWTNKVLRP